MSKRQAHVVLVTYTPRADASPRVVWSDCSHDQILQLPLSWKLHKADEYKLKHGVESELPQSIQHALQRSKPAALQFYGLHAGTLFRGSLDATMISESLSNGVATLHVAAEPVESLAQPRTDDTSGMSARGEIVGILPATAVAALATKTNGKDEEGAGSGEDMESHPVTIRNSSIGIDAIDDSELDNRRGLLDVLRSPGKLLNSTSAKAAAADGGSAGEGSHGDGDGDDNDGEDDGGDSDSGTNPLLQVLGLRKGQTAGMQLTLKVQLFPLAPPEMADVVRWQQARGWLAKRNVFAVWELSSVTLSSTLRAMAPFIVASTVLATWTFAYVRVPFLRSNVDRALASLHSTLPRAVQGHASALWHTLVPPWMLRQVCTQLPPQLRKDTVSTKPTMHSPSLRTPKAQAQVQQPHQLQPDCIEPAVSHIVAVTASAAVVAALALTRSARVLTFWLRRVVFPATGHGAVYGVSIIASRTLTHAELSGLKADTQERPDLGHGTSEDTQQRFWIGADRDAKRAKRDVASDAAWRKKFSIDSILSDKQPHFYTLKATFPHGILGKTSDGTPVLAMRLGVLHKQYSKIDDAGLTTDDIVKHLALINEYIFTQIATDPLPGGRLITVIDFDGIGLMDMQGKASKMVGLSSKISKYHYPDRLERSLLINCPGMINQLWSLAKGMLDENARSRTSLYTKKDTKKGLQELLADEDIPKDWGGTRSKPFYNGAHEADLFKLVAKNNGVKLEDLAIEGQFDPSIAKAASK